MRTNASSKKQSPRSTKNRKAIDRPFNPAHLAQAERAIDRYTLVIRKDPEAGYLGTWLEFPGVLGVGDTFAKCHTEARDLLKTALACLIEVGESLPAPAGENRRSVQLNIRLSAFEKTRLESLADRQGFRSISDYVRFAALNKVA